MSELISHTFQPPRSSRTRSATAESMEEDLQKLLQGLQALRKMAPTSTLCFDAAELLRKGLAPISEDDLWYEVQLADDTAIDQLQGLSRDT